MVTRQGIVHRSVEAGFTREMAAVQRRALMML